MKLKQRLILIAYFLLIPFLAWSGPKITGQGGGGGGTGATIDDNAGNGDTTLVWSADKVFDQFALKQGADADLTTWAGLTPHANFQTMVPHSFSEIVTDLSLVIGVNTQAWNTLLDSFSALTPATNGIIGWGPTKNFGVFTTMVLDNSAAQFSDSTDTTKKVLIDPSNQGAGQTGTIKAPVNGTATLAAGTQIAHNGITADLGAVHFVTTGTIRGGVDTYTIGANTSIAAASQYGSMFYITSTATASMANLSTGMNVCFFLATGAQVRIDPGASDAVWLTGVASAAGAYIQSSTLGDSVCLIYKSVNNWWAHKNGTWTTQ